jgi:hypothetical protein
MRIVRVIYSDENDGTFLGYSYHGSKLDAANEMIQFLIEPWC